jgi:Eukaryotic aspartyl protease
MPHFQYLPFLWAFYGIYAASASPVGFTAKLTPRGHAESRTPRLNSRTTATGVGYITDYEDISKFPMTWLIVDYYMTVNIGSEQNPFQLLIDTGSSDMIVAASTCPSDQCTNTNKLAAEDLQVVGNWSESYKSPDTYASGDITQDTVSIFGASINQMKLGAATAAQGYIFSNVPSLPDLADSGGRYCRARFFCG